MTAAAILDGPWDPAGLGLVSLLHMIVFLLICADCLLHPRDPRSALLWGFVAWSFPIFGPLVYLTFGVNRVHGKGWHKQHSDQNFLNRRRSREQEAQPLAYWRQLQESLVASPADHRAAAFNATLNRIAPHHPLLGGNRIKCLVEGSETYRRMLAAIATARDHIHLQTYILGDDRIGRELMEALSARARDGVCVRVLYDQFGSASARLRRFFHHYRNTPNLTIIGFTQVNPLKRQFQLNLRNHRKIMVIDGAHGFTGGLNVHAGHLPDGNHPPIRDYHFDCHGPIVGELQYTFLRDWYYMTDEDADELLSERHFPHVEPAGSAAARIINGGPTSESEALTDLFFNALESARQQVIAVTPYFVPPDDLLHAFRAAAQRGVEVKLILPGRNNHISVAYASQSRYERLLAAGVRIFERQTAFIHAKAMLIDDAVAVVGSPNLDVRSLRLNYETNLVVMEPELSNQLKDVILDDLAQSIEVDLAAWRERPASRKIRENLYNLMTPIL